jgi:hypothetical protein
MDGSNTEFENTDKKIIISTISERYSSVIADIYAKYHVSPFTDIQKHNEGIVKAMVEFAIFYKDDTHYNFF